MPLTIKVSFETVLEKGNRLQIPKLIRWQFKMEQNQVLRVGVSPKYLGGGPSFFMPRWINRDEYLFPS